VLKYQLIPTRTAGEEAFWRCGQTDRQTEWQNDRTTDPQTVTMTDNKGRYKAERSRTNKIHPTNIDVKVF